MAATTASPWTRQIIPIAMISGPSRDYLWILARTRQLPPAVLNGLLRQAKALGFATDQLIMVCQDRDDV